jgi:hypothetical protein
VERAAGEARAGAAEAATAAAVAAGEQAAVEAVAAAAGSVESVQERALASASELLQAKLEENDRLRQASARHAGGVHDAGTASAP